jgi:hypothetical protein
MKRRSGALAAAAIGVSLLWAAPALGDEESDLRGVLEGLEQGIVALEKLGLAEERARLQHIADDVRAKLGGAPRQPLRPQGDEPRAAGQREAIEVMHMALQALENAGRSDAAELLERAIHARRMDLEGRSDDEAAQIRGRRPTAAQQIEILRLAARLLNENGKPDRAEAVGRMADRMLQRQGAERRPQGPAMAPPPPLPEGSRPRPREEAMRRLDAIQHQIEDLQRALDETRHELRERRAPRDLPPPGPPPRDWLPREDRAR